MENLENKRIALLLSGGVDSSVVLHELCGKGVKPDCFYIKIGPEEDEEWDCSSEEDMEMATAVAARYGCRLDIAGGKDLVPFFNGNFHAVVIRTVFQFLLQRQYLLPQRLFFRAVCFRIILSGQVFDLVDYCRTVGRITGYAQRGGITDARRQRAIHCNRVIDCFICRKCITGSCRNRIIRRIAAASPDIIAVGILIQFGLSGICSKIDIACAGSSHVFANRN